MKDRIVKTLDEWVPPESNDARILGAPNIFKALHGWGLQPRTIVGETEWNKMRKLCYFQAGYTCEACGEYQGPGKCHCLERGTQVLTRHGWKNIEDITVKDEVAQFNPSGREITFVNPTRTNHKHVDKIIEIGYKKIFKVGYSDDHRILLEYDKSYGREPSEWVIKKPLEVKFNGAYKIPTAGYGRGDGRLSDKERVYIAINADGSLQYAVKSTGQYVFNVSVVKDRKKKRLAELLAKSGLKYTKVRPNHSGCDSYFVWVDNDCKDFWSSFDVQMPAQKAREFIDELVKWDGWEGERLTRGVAKIKGRCWYTTKPDQADFVQAVCVQGGISTSKSVTARKVRSWEFAGRKPSTNCKPQINIEFLNRLGRGTTTMVREEKEYDGEVYCLTVPTHYFVARSRDGYVFITGNCHELFRCNWKEGYSEFDRLICLCKKCHLVGQHSGRALTLYKKGDAVMNKSYILDGIEHVFKAVHKYNQTHDDEILMYPLFAIEYTKDPLLGEPVKQLIEKYDIHFYGLCKAAPWEQWRMIYDGKEYKTPYANVTDYEKKMEEYDKKNPQVVQNPFATKKEWDWGSDISKAD